MTACDEEQFFRRLVSLPERQMRLAVAAERLAELPPGEAVAMLQTAVEHAMRRRDNADVILDALTTVLASPARLGYERLADLYAEATVRGSEPVRQLLIAPAATSEADDRELPFARELAAMPLGYKKTLARTADRDRIDRLLNDPDPRVIENLLMNPRINERDVVKLAARRPNVQPVLATLFRSKWLQRYAVKQALVKNPYTPVEIAVKLAPMLLAADLREVVQMGGLHAQVRAAATRVLQAR